MMTRRALILSVLISVYATSNLVAAGFFDKLKNSVTGKKKAEEAQEEVEAYEPPKYEFVMPSNESIPDHKMKLIYTPIVLNVQGSSAGIESQINTFKIELNDGLKDIIKNKKFTIYHEVEDKLNDMQNLPAHEILQMLNSINQTNNLDEVLTSIPYVKKKRSSALVKTYISISLKYELFDASNQLKSILVGNKIKKGFLYFSGDVSVEYIEPMTKEILVQQKFKMKDGKAPIQVSYNDQSGIIKWSSGNRSGAKIYSTDHIKALDEILTSSYKNVMQEYYDYLSPEELTDLKDIIDELKSMKKF